MAVEPPVVSRCPGCKRMFLMAHAPLVGSIASGIDSPDTLEPPSAWRDAYLISDSTRHDICDAIGTLALTTREHVSPRRLIWWSDCHPYRRDSTLRFEPSEEMVENLTLLAERLDPVAPEDRIDAAEIARQLGGFGQALEVLSSLHLKDFQNGDNAFILEARLQQIGVLAQSERREVARCSEPNKEASRGVFHRVARFFGRA